MINKILFYEAKDGRLRQNRLMKRVTLSREQQKFVRDNHEKKSILEMANELNIGFGRLHSNMRVMGLVKRRCTPKEKQYLLWNYTINN